MKTENNNISSNVWRFPVLYICLLVAGMLAIGVMAGSGLKSMVNVWNYSEEYGYGYVIPFITLFLIWRKYPDLERREFTGTWLGIFVLVFGCLLVFVGDLTTIPTIVQYGALIVFLGLIYSSISNSIRPILVPLLFLAFMIPLPGFFINNLSTKLQLISSQLGVDIIRLFNISVYLEGNVIDLGVFKLQVVDACSGLNYLFPLMSLAFIAVYFFKAPFWQKVIIFLSSIPITIFMNSFRIGMIGLLVNLWGIKQAKGFLHFFEGWVIFMVCLLIVFGEMWLFNKFSANKRPLSDVFGIEIPERVKPDASSVRYRATPAPLVISVIVLLIGAIVSTQIQTRKEIHPPRASFSSFPLKIGDWTGISTTIGEKYLKVLKLSDYFMADYTKSDDETINFYSAYYKSQRSGASAHSPHSCIPGGGWVIKQFKTVQLKDIDYNGVPLRVNRLLIQKGTSTLLVYYWFQERGRIITNEFMVKWYILWDALTRNRTDGALVRLTTPVSLDGSVHEADNRLQSFLKLVEPMTNKYIPK